MASPAIDTCACCGLVQRMPPVPARHRARCPRCGTVFRRWPSVVRGNRLATALALAALILYPLAVTLPMIRVERFGHRNDASILQGTRELLSEGDIFVGVIVLLCSVVLPLAKLVGLLTLGTGGMLLRREHRAMTYHVVEWTGRWGMLDVLLVAILVAVLKVGDYVQVTAGPAAFAFTLCVLLSLLATAAFDPHSLWHQPAAAEPDHG